jgi:hypothetical protein
VVVPGARGAAVEDETGVWRRWGVERAARASGTRGREAARRAGKKRVETGGGAPAIDWRDARVLWERRSFAARATSTANGRGTHDLAAMTRARASLLARLARFANHARERSRVRCSPSPSLAEGRGMPPGGRARRRFSSSKLLASLRRARWFLFAIACASERKNVRERRVRDERPRARVLNVRPRGSRASSIARRRGSNGVDAGGGRDKHDHRRMSKQEEQPRGLFHRKTLKATWGEIWNFIVKNETALTLKNRLAFRFTGDVSPVVLSSRRRSSSSSSSSSSSILSFYLSSLARVAPRRPRPLARPVVRRRRLPVLLTA